LISRRCEISTLEGEEIGPTLKKLALAIVAAIALALPTPMLAHPNHSKKVMGTVTMAAPDHVMVKSTDGKEETIAIDAKTKIVRGKAKAKVGDLKVGTRVVISLTAKEPPTAAEIQLAAAPTSQQ
jgi:hypothetical protein